MKCLAGDANKLCEKHKPCFRSLAACEQLSRSGYKEVAWVNGGFDTARKEDLPVINAPDLRYGGIGGLSEFLGWTDAQRQNSQTEGFIGGFQNVLKLVCSTGIIDVQLAYII